MSGSVLAGHHIISTNIAANNEVIQLLSSQKNLQTGLSFYNNNADSSRTTYKTKNILDTDAGDNNITKNSNLSTSPIIVSYHLSRLAIEHLHWNATVTFTRVGTSGFPFVWSGLKLFSSMMGVCPTVQELETISALGNETWEPDADGPQDDPEGIRTWQVPAVGGKKCKFQWTVTHLLNVQAALSRSLRAHSRNHYD